MRTDGYFLETLIVASPVVVTLWWALFRRKIQRSRLNRWLISGATAFLMAPTFMAPYGTWFIYPAWCMVFHLYFGVDPFCVLLLCVIPVLVTTVLVYGLSSHLSS
jgi:hypothetical protein